MANTEICPVAFRCITEKLRSCQDSQAGHAKLTEKLLADMKKFELIDFFNAFTHALGSVLITKIGKNPRVDRIIDFVARFVQSLSTTSKADEKKKKSDSEQEKPQSTDDDATSMDCDEEDDEEEIEQHPFILALFDFLIDKSRVNNDSVRHRCCQILAKLMGALSSEQFIDQNLYERLCDVLLERLRDINSRVQVQAVAAIFRLQDPTDRECRVTKAIVFIMTHDPNWQVRYEALSHCAFRGHTLRDIIDRVRDPHPTVHRKALLLLSEKVLIKHIRIEDRLFILNYSLKSEDKSVLDMCCKKLLPSWLAFKENDLVKLLKALDVVGATETCELMLNKMHAESTLDSLCNEFVQSGLLTEDRIIVKEKLDPESVFYWQWVCSKCKVGDKKEDTTTKRVERSNDKSQADMTREIEEGENLLDNQLLPSLTYFCDYVEDFLLTEFEQHHDGGEAMDVTNNHNDNEFVLKQLINMLSMIDMSDSHGKKKLVTLCEKIFTRAHLAFAFDLIMSVYRKAVPNVEHRINRIVELISDIKDPSAASTQQQTQKESTNITTESLGNATANMSLETTNAAEPSTLSIHQLSLKISELKFERFKKKDAFDNLYNELKTQSVDLAYLSQLREEISAIEEELKVLQAAKISATTTASTASTNDIEMAIESSPVHVERFEPIKHCLRLASCLLQDPKINSLTPQIRSLFDSLILVNISCVDDEVRQEAVVALNLVCILKLEMAQRHIPLLLEVIERDKKEIMLEAFKAVINSIMAFSINKLINGEEEGTQRIMQVLTACLDDEDVEVRTVAVEGLCKLYMCGHIISAKLFSKLFVMYHSRLNETALRLKSILSAFLPQFAYFKPTYQLCVEEAFMITVRYLLAAPADSHLAEINILKVVETLFRLTNPKHLLLQSKKQRVINTNYCHVNIVKSICHEILQDDDDTFKIKTYLKMLHMADLTDSHFVSLKEIAKMAQDVSVHIEQSLEDKTAEKSAQKFYDSVVSMLKSKPEYNEEQMTQQQQHENEESQQLVEQAVEPTSSSQKSDEQDEMIDQQFELAKKGVKTTRRLSTSAFNKKARVDPTMTKSGTSKESVVVNERGSSDDDDDDDEVAVIGVVNLSIVDDSLDEEQPKSPPAKPTAPRNTKLSIRSSNVANQLKSSSSSPSKTSSNRTVSVYDDDKKESSRAANKSSTAKKIDTAATSTPTERVSSITILRRVR